MIFVHLNLYDFEIMFICNVAHELFDLIAEADQEPFAVFADEDEVSHDQVFTMVLCAIIHDVLAAVLVMSLNLGMGFSFARSPVIFIKMAYPVDIRPLMK